MTAFVGTVVLSTIFCQATDNTASVESLQLLSALAKIRSTMNVVCAKFDSPVCAAFALELAEATARFTWKEYSSLAIEALTRAKESPEPGIRLKVLRALAQLYLAQDSKSSKGTSILQEAWELAASISKALLEEGRYQDSEPYVEEALAILAKLQAIGPEHLRLTSTLLFQSALYGGQGKYGEQSVSLQKASEISKLYLGKAHPLTVFASFKLASFYLSHGEPEKSTSLMSELIEVVMDTPASLEYINLSSVGAILVFSMIKANNTDGEESVRLILESEKRAKGPEHHDVGYLLNAFGSLLVAQGRFGEAEPIVREAQRIIEKTANSQDESLATVNENLAYCISMKDKEVSLESARLLLVAANVRARVISREVPSLEIVEKEKIRENYEMIRHFSGGRDLALTAAVTSKNEAVRRLATEAAAIRLWTGKARSLERKVGPDISMQALQGVLKRNQDRALVEIGEFFHIDFKSGLDKDGHAAGTWSYAACIFRGNGSSECVEIKAEAVNKLNILLGLATKAPTETKGDKKRRRGWLDPEQNPLDPQHAQLLTKEFLPLLTKLTGVTQLFVAADGDVARLPFDLLKATTEPGAKSWAETFDIVYVNSGRDLLWHADRRTATGPPLAIGLNTYAKSTAAAGHLGAQDATCPMDAGGFESLTLAEKMAKEFVSDDAERALIGKRASKEDLVQQLKNNDAPSTIGLFLHGCQDTKRKEFALAISAFGPGRWGYLGTSELAKIVLKAEGTELIAITCWGGEVNPAILGDMRQVATVIGARFLLAPMWSVRQDVAEIFVREFRLARKALNPVASLKRAQEITKKRFPHPHYWAGFVLSGTGALDSDN